MISDEAKKAMRDNMDSIYDVKLESIKGKNGEDIFIDDWVVAQMTVSKSRILDSTVFPDTLKAKLLEQRAPIVGRVKSFYQASEEYPEHGHGVSLYDGTELREFHQSHLTKITEEEAAVWILKT